MQNLFLNFLILTLTFIGCEVNVLREYLNDINALMVFLSLSFFAICLIKFFSSEEEPKLPGKPEVFLFLYLIWSASSFYFSVNSDITIYPALKCLGALAFGLSLFLYLNNTDQLNKIWLISFIFSGIHGAAGIIEQCFPYFFENPNLALKGSHSLFFHENFFACYLLIHLPIGIYLLYKFSNPFLRALIGIGWLCIFVSLGFSDSLAGQLIAGLQLFAAFLFFRKKNPDKTKLLGFIVFIGILVFWGFKSFILGVDPFMDIKRLNNSNAISNLYFWHVGNRLVYWLGAWKIFTKNWLMGSGLWSFSDLYPYTGLSEIYPNTGFPSHPHNAYFQTAAETGLIGIGLLMTCILLLLKYIVKNFKKLDGEDRELNFVLILSFSGFLIHNITENNWLISLFIYYFVLQIVSLGLLNRGTSCFNFKNTFLIQKHFQFPVMALVIILCSISLASYYQYHQIIDRTLPNSQSVNDVRLKLDRSKELCQRCGLPYFYQGRSNYIEGQRLKNVQLIYEAEKEFAEAINRTPYNTNLYMFQGDIYRLLGKKVEAEKFYQQAMRDPRYKEASIERINKLNVLK